MDFSFPSTRSSSIAIDTSPNLNIECLIMDQLSSSLTAALEELQLDIHPDGAVKEIRLPSSLTISQVDHVLGLLSEPKNIEVDIKWFHPVSTILLKKKKGDQMLTEPKSFVVTLRPFKARLLLPSQMRDLLLRLCSIKLPKRHPPYSRPLELPSAYNIITYVNTDPVVPNKFLRSSTTAKSLITGLNGYGSLQFKPQPAPMLTEAERRLLDAIAGSSRLHILTGLNKLDKLNLTVALHNEAFLEGRPCRIIYLQSMSILTFWMALAVKEMSGEQMWNASGYQITLESKSSPNNNIIFFELATFIKYLNRGIETRLVTHLLLDIDQESNCFFNLMLLYLKENLDSLRHIRLFLLTSTKAHAERLAGYFEPEEVDHLDYIDFMEQSDLLSPGCARQQQQVDITHLYLEDIANFIPNLEKTPCLGSQDNNQEMERLMYEIYSRDFNLSVMIEFIGSFPALINYQCSQLNGLTPLVLSILRGTVTEVYRLLALGANAHLPSWNGMTPIEWAIHGKREEAFHLLFVHLYATNPSFDLNLSRYYTDRFLSASANRESFLEIIPGSGYSRPANQVQPPLYSINTQLILRLLNGMIRQINHSTQHEASMGVILVLLPSYNSISTLRKLIISELASNVEFPFTIFALYPHLPNNELEIALEMLKNTASQVRIILSTFTLNSLLLPDIRYVINTGILLEKVQSAFSPVSLYRLISNRAVDQIGDYRNYRQLFDQNAKVYFYNLFSRADVLNDGTGKNEVCEDGDSSRNANRAALNETDSIYHCIFSLKGLQLKSSNCATIRSAFSSMLNQPRPYILESTLGYLSGLKMFDENENFTELGRILADLAIEPHYAKMIIYAVLLRCLDPILTIVCALSSPNCLELSSTNSDQRAQEMNYLSSLSRQSFSDHLTLVYAFQKWQEMCRSNPTKNGTYDKNGIILFSSFELIYSLRTKILGQLRAVGFVKGKGPMNIRSLNANSENFTLVKAAITAGSGLGNVALFDEANPKLIRSGTEPSTVATFLHPNSVLTYHLNVKSHYSVLGRNLIVCDRKVACGSAAYLETCTLVSPLSVAIFTDEPTNGMVSVKNNCISFNTSTVNGLRITGEDAAKVFELRARWTAFVGRRIINMHAPVSEEENAMVNEIVRLCTTVDELSGFGSHPSIGRAPQVMSTYFCSTKMVAPK